ncbi:MAG: LLM class flavin-dependent oxidoreductase [Actinomycetota bacterium]
MSLGIGIFPGGLDRAGLDFARDAERLGVDSIWAPEAWMYDALTPLAYLAAVTERVRLATGVVQLGARSPAMLAMSALALQQMSDGRFVLGVGTSGPQVMEGWHGVRFDKPVTRTSETIDIIRAVASGERLSYDGSVYTLPLPDGQGRAIRSPVAGAEIPIHVASIGPANLRLTGAKADGWIGTAFLPESADAFLDPIREGAASADRSLGDVELSVAVGLEFTDDPEPAARRHAAGYAFTIGAMGSTSTNFYNRAFARQGFGEAVEEVHRLWQAGEKERAGERVPLEIGLHTNLIGDDAAVTERLRRYRDAGVSTLRVGLSGDDLADRLDQLARLLDLVSAVNAESPAVS